MSGLDYQVVDVKFTKGLDEKTQPKLVVPGDWTYLANMSLSDEYTPKIRDGHAALVASANGNGLALRANELLVLNGSAASTVSTTAGAAQQVSGKFPFVDISTSEVVFNSGNQGSQDMAYGGGYACYVWLDYDNGMSVNGIKCTLVDEATGAKLVSGHSITASAGASSPRVVFVGGAFYVLYLDTTIANSLVCAVIDVTAPSVVGNATLLYNSASLPIANFDACAFGSLVFATFVFADATTSVLAALVTRTGTVPSLAVGPSALVTEANVANASIQALTCCLYASGTRMGVFLVHTAGGAIGGGLVGVVVDSTLAITTGATRIDTAIPPVASATHVTATAVGAAIQVFYDQQSSYLSAAYRPIRTVTVSSTLGATVAAYTVYNSACFRINGSEASGPQGPFIAGKAFTYNGGAYLPVCILENYYRPAAPLSSNCDTLSTQCAFFLLDCSSAGGAGTVIAGALYRTMGLIDTTLGGAAPVVSTPCSTPAIGTGFGICLQQRGRLDLVAGINDTPVGLTRVTMTPRDASSPSSAQLGESTYLSGGQLANYDGVQVSEAVFPIFPEGISAVVAASGAGSLTVGVHQVLAVYEWTDGAGNRHQSAPSLPISVTVVNATDQINILVPTTQISQKANSIVIVVYMTAAGGTTFYRTISNFTSPALNTTAASTVAISIGTPQIMTDARLTQNELLYTQPNNATTTLPNIAPGPTAGVAAFQNRLFYIKADQPLRIGYSQELLDNTGLQFNESLTIKVPAESGGLVALAPLDEKLIVFCSRRIYVVYGTGPNPDGSYGQYSAPQDIQSDCGCSDAASVLTEVPGGIIFKSQKGWQMLGRDLSVKYIGEGVASYDSQSVRSAVLVGNKQQARFIVTDGTTLVYSYLVNAWSVFLQPTGPYTAAAAVWWSADNAGAGGYVTVSSLNGLNHDTPGLYYDSIGSNGPTTFVISGYTSWLRLSAMESYQRVRRLYLTATSGSSPDSTLSIWISTDDDASSSSFFNVVTSTVGAPAAAFDLRHKLAVQKCKSMQLRFSETPTNYYSPRITGVQAMALEVGMKRGVRKTPAAQNVG